MKCKRHNWVTDKKIGLRKNPGIILLENTSFYYYFCSVCGLRKIETSRQPNATTRKTLSTSKLVDFIIDDYDIYEIENDLPTTLHRVGYFDGEHVPPGLFWVDDGGAFYLHIHDRDGCWWAGPIHPDETLSR